MARTARQRAALRKAQLASARKRKGRGRGKKIAKIAAGAALAAGATYAASKASKKYASNRMRKKVRKHLATDAGRVHNRAVLKANRANKKWGTKDTMTEGSAMYARAVAKRRMTKRKTKKGRKYG